MQAEVYFQSDEGLRTQREMSLTLTQMTLMSGNVQVPLPIENGMILEPMKVQQQQQQQPYLKRQRYSPYATINRKNMM